MENAKALGTEYPYREEDFATPEYMECMLVSLAEMTADSIVEDCYCIPRRNRLVTREDKVKYFEKLLYMYLERDRTNDINTSLLLALKHIGSAPNQIEGGQRFFAILMFGIRYFDDPMYQVMQMPFKELFSDGFEPNVPSQNN